MMTKLSDRFKNSTEPKVKIVEAEDNPLMHELLEKVNSVPYWNEYPQERQRQLVRFFVKNSQAEDKETVFESLVSCVTGFGPMQKLLDNEKVSAVFVKDADSVLIEINGRVFDTEMKLSQNMFQYMLNYAKYLQANFEHYQINIDGVDITIRK